MGIIWTAHRLDEPRATELAALIAAQDETVTPALDELEADEDRTIDVDKAWHALDRLYAAVPAPSPIATGRLVDSEDVVVGVVPPDRVSAIVAVMGRIDASLLRKGYDARRFQREEIYPQIWDEDDVLDVYVLPYDAELREFYRAAAEHGEAVLWHLS